MRSFVAYGIGALSAVAIGAAVAATVNANNDSASFADRSEIVSEANEKSGNDRSSNDTASIAAAEERAQSAEARAIAAEERVRCEKERQEASNRGAVVGGITGAVIGSQVAGDGAKSEGGAIGGVAGVLTGRQIAKKDHRC